MKKVLIPAIVILIAGCSLFDSNDEPSYPALKAEQLYGCWFEVNPSGYECIETCFDSTEAYYSILYESQPEEFYAEWFGEFLLLERNHLGARYKSKTNKNSERESNWGGAFCKK